MYIIQKHKYKFSDNCALWSSEKYKFQLTPSVLTEFLLLYTY